MKDTYELEHIPRLYFEPEAGTSLNSTSSPRGSTCVDASETTPRARPQGMAHAKKQGYRSKVLSFTAAVILTTGGLVAFFLTDIFALHEWHREGSSVITSADLSRLLTISQA